MSQYNMTIQEICNDGIRKMLNEKSAEEWTDYDSALACMFYVQIPDGKMPKELLIHTLLTADKYTALSLVKRSEAKEYREEAINLFIERYRANWINRHLAENIKYAEDLLKESTRSLIRTMQWWIYSQDVPVTWKNIEKLLEICENSQKSILKEMMKYLSKLYGEAIPDYLLEKVKDNKI